MSPLQRRALLSSLTTTIAANLPSFLTGGMAVQMQADLQFGSAALGVAIGGFFAAGALTSAWAGRLAERVGAARSLRLAAISSGVLQLLIASITTNWWILFSLLLLCGFANAWAQPASNVVLVQVVPTTRLGLALGLQKSAIPAAALLGGLAVPAVALTVGWRWAFVAGAAIAVGSAVQVPRHGIDAPSHTIDAPSHTIDAPSHTIDDTAPAVDDAPRPSRRRGVPDVARRHILTLALGVGFGSAASNALSAFIVLSSVSAGIDEAVAGLLLTLGSVFGIAVRMIIGSRADRDPTRALPIMVAMFCLASLSFLMFATGVAWVFFLATPLAFATAYAWPGLFHLAVVRANPSAPGAATGLAMTGTLTGAVSGPVIFGVLADRGTYGAAWLAGTCFLLLAAGVVTSVRGPFAPRPPLAID